MRTLAAFTRSADAGANRWLARARESGCGPDVLGCLEELGEDVIDDAFGRPDKPHAGSKVALEMLMQAQLLVAQSKFFTHEEFLRGVKEICEVLVDYLRDIRAYSGSVRDQLVDFRSILMAQHNLRGAGLPEEVEDRPVL